MTVILQHRIYRKDLKANPNVLYVFGDNLQRVGYGGQAAECRDEPNAVGLATKRVPGMNEEDFFIDSHLEEVTLAERDSIARLFDHVENNGVIVWPLDGIGTGLSELPQRAPAIYEFYCDLLTELSKEKRE